MPMGRELLVFWGCFVAKRNPACSSHLLSVVGSALEADFLARPPPTTLTTVPLEKSRAPEKRAAHAMPNWPQEEAKRRCGVAWLSHQGSVARSLADHDQKECTAPLQDGCALTCSGLVESLWGLPCP